MDTDVRTSKIGGKLPTSGSLSFPIHERICKLLLQNGFLHVLKHCFTRSFGRFILGGGGGQARQARGATGSYVLDASRPGFTPSPTPVAESLRTRTMGHHRTTRRPFASFGGRFIAPWDPWDQAGSQGGWSGQKKKNLDRAFWGDRRNWACMTARLFSLHEVDGFLAGATDSSKRRGRWLTQMDPYSQTRLQ